MNKLINISEKTNSILQYILALSIILECNSIYSQLYKGHLYIRTSFIAIAVLCMVFITLSRKNKLYKEVIYFTIYDYLCSLFMLINTNNLTGKFITIIVFMCFFPILLFYLSNNTKKEICDLLTKFVRIVSVLCFISLFFWIFGSVLNIIHPTSIIKIIWGKPFSVISSYFFVHFDTQAVSFFANSLLTRNTGIFTEGPMYSIIIIVALVFNNFMIPILLNKKEKINQKKYNIVLLTTLLTTFSFTGIVCALVILLFYAVGWLKKHHFEFDKKFALLIIGLLIISPLVVEFTIKKINSSSASHRTTDVINGINVFIKKPIFGYGINHDRPTELDSTVGYGYSNAIIPVLTDGGIILSIIYFTPALLLLKKGIKKKKRIELYLFIIYFIILFTTLIQYRMIMFLLISIIYLLYYNEWNVRRKVDE